MYGPEDYEYQSQRARRGPSLFGAFLVSAVTSVAVFFTLRYLEHRGYVDQALGGGSVEVPSVVGTPAGDARATLQGRGLMLVVEAERADVKTPAGAVVVQKPLAGSQVRRGTPVYTIVSKGVSQLPVPNVVGQPAEEAIRALAGAGLNGASAKTIVGDGPAGVVLAMTPAAGTLVIPGAGVELTVSAARTTKPVPKVVGLRLSKARDALAGAGLTVGSIRYDYDSDRGEGVVLRQSLAEGAEAAPGATIDLVVNE